MSPLEAERYLAEYLLGVGQLMAAQGNLQTFAHLMGMAARAAPDYHSLLVPQLFITETDQYIELARAKLGDETYTAAWHVGHELSLQESIHQVARYLQ